MLIVFSGLPGSGKTTLARELAARRSATYVRIDAIEQAIRNARVLVSDVGTAGYDVALAVAEANLMSGRVVIADCVNPVAASRIAWRMVADRACVEICEIEVVCSDLIEHRRRVETRRPDVPGLVPPTWLSVQGHEYEPWLTERFVVDTAGVGPHEAVSRIEAHLNGVGA